MYVFVMLFIRNKSNKITCINDSKAERQRGNTEVFITSHSQLYKEQAKVTHLHNELHIKPYLRQIKYTIAQLGKIGKSDTRIYILTGKALHTHVYNYGTYMHAYT